MEEELRCPMLMDQKPGRKGSRKCNRPQEPYGRYCFKCEVMREEEYDNYHLVDFLRERWQKQYGTKYLYLLPCSQFTIDEEEDFLLLEAKTAAEEYILRKNFTIKYNITFDARHEKRLRYLAYHYSQFYDVNWEINLITFKNDYWTKRRERVAVEEKRRERREIQKDQKLPWSEETVSV